MKGQGQKQREIKGERGVCFDFLRGSCTLGDQCKFRHESPSLTASPSPLSLSNASNTPIFEQGPKSFPQQTSKRQEAKEPKELCRNFAKGKCLRGDKCKYLHQHPPANAPSNSHSRHGSSKLKPLMLHRPAPTTLNSPSHFHAKSKLKRANAEQASETSPAAFIPSFSFAAPSSQIALRFKVEGEDSLFNVRVSHLDYSEVYQAIQAKLRQQQDGLRQRYSLSYNHAHPTTGQIQNIRITDTRDLNDFIGLHANPSDAYILVKPILDGSARLDDRRNPKRSRTGEARGEWTLTDQVNWLLAESKCNKCGAQIGGSSHRLLADNLIAQEMDGSRHSAYTLAQDPNNFDPAEWQ